MNIASVDVPRPRSHVYTCPYLRTYALMAVFIKKQNGIYFIIFRSPSSRVHFDRNMFVIRAVNLTIKNALKIAENSL